MKNVYADGQFVAMFSGEGGGSGIAITFHKRIIEQGWDGAGSITYTFDEDIDDCILVLTYTRETTLSDTRYTLTLASGSYEEMEDSGAVIGSTTEERVVYLKVHDIRIGDTLYMYNYGDLKTADILKYTEGGSSDVYTIEQGQTISTNTATANVESGKYYLFDTVYGDVGFSSGAELIVGNTNSIYTASGIVRCGCIIKATANTITYNRYGNVSDNEYTELDVTEDCGLASFDSSWSSGTSITAIKDKFYFLALADGETGNITGADVLVEHKLEDTVSNGTRFLIVKATGNSIALNNGNLFYYRQIGIAI